MPGEPLTVGLHLDLDTVDKDIKEVADRISHLGETSKVTIRVTEAIEKAAELATPTGGTEVAASRLDAKVASIGTSLATGMNRGISASSGTLTELTAKTESVIERLTATTITMFERIDSSMKFPKFAKFLTDMAGKARNLGAIGLPISGALKLIVAYKGVSNWLSSIGDVADKSFGDLAKKHGIVYASLVKITHGIRTFVNATIRIITLQPLILGIANSFGKVAIAAGNAVTNIARIVTLQPILSAFGATVARVSGLMFRLGTLGVFEKQGAAAKTLGTAIGGVSGPVQKLGRSFMSLATQIGAALGLIGVAYKIVEFFRSGIKAASDLNETVSKTQVVFGDAFGEVEAQADRLSRSYGLLKSTQLDMASGFGAMALGAGISQKAAASLSNQMTMMAADLSSSVNIPMTEAGEKIRSALAGEAEPLRQFGVNISEQAVNAYAMAHGFERVGGELTLQAKIMARSALVTRGLSYAQGDLARTSESAANQFRKTGGLIAGIGERIGAVLMPGIQAGVKGFNKFLESILEWADRSQKTISRWSENFAFGVRVVVHAFGNLSQVWGMITTAGAVFVGAIVKAVSGLSARLGRTWDSIKVQGLSAFGNMARSGISAIDRLTRGSATALISGFSRALEWIQANWKGVLVEVATIGVPLVMRATGAVRTTITTVLGRVWTWIATNWRGVFTGLYSVAAPLVIQAATYIYNTVTNVIGSAWKWIKTNWYDTWLAVRLVATPIVNAIANYVYTTVVSVIGNAWTWLKANGVDTFKWLWTTTGDITMNGVKYMYDVITTGLGATWAWLKANSGQIAGVVASAVGIAADVIIKASPIIIGAVAVILTDLKEFLVKETREVFAGMGDEFMKGITDQNWEAPGVAIGRRLGEGTRKGFEAKGGWRWIKDSIIEELNKPLFVMNKPGQKPPIGSLESMVPPKVPRSIPPIAPAKTPEISQFVGPPKEALKPPESPFEKVIEDFKKKFAIPTVKIPNFDEMSKKLKEQWDKFTAGLGTPPGTPSGKFKPPLPEEKQPGEYKLGGALEIGSREAFSAISRGMAGDRKNTIAQQSLGRLDSLVNLSKEHLEIIKHNKAAFSTGSSFGALQAM